VTLPIVTPPAADIPAVASQAPPASSSGTSSTPAPADLRLAFNTGGTDLSPDAAAAIKRFASEAAASDAASFNVVAYAAGKPEDPSTARRLSLSRALAVRSALMAEGVTSSRIYVRALGSQAAGGPPDRVDISALGGNATGASAGGNAR
jgi:outer membrane protein OmpA-like peptidoglycan-associated protein